MSIPIQPLLNATEENLRSLVQDQGFRAQGAVRAVLEMKSGNSPSAPGVCIVNVSLGDRKRPFASRVSAWARAIDWLAYEHGILFVISAGNADEPKHNLKLVHINDSNTYAALTAEDRTKTTLAAVHHGLPDRRILSPGEAVNAITVGALHVDAIGDQAIRGFSFDPQPVGILPTPVSRTGPGLGNAVKPEVLLPGGRLRITPEQTARPVMMRPSQPSRFGGLQVAGAALDASGAPRLDAWSGATSAATALATRALHFIHDALEVAYPDTFTALPSRTRALILKALLVHRAEIPDESRQLIEEVFGPSDRDKAQQRASNVLRLFGFGVPKIDEVIGCIESRATLWGYGSLGQDDARVFKLPLPASLADTRCHRSLSVALAWFTPITPGRRAYRSVRLIVEEPERIDLVATRPKPGQPDRRRVERGTLFTRTWIGSAPRAFMEGDQLELRVARKPDPFDDLPDSVEFALVVTLEANANLPIYEEVKAPLAVKPAIAIPIRVRPAP